MGFPLLIGIFLSESVTGSYEVRVRYARSLFPDGQGSSNDFDSSIRRRMRGFYTPTEEGT